MKKLSRIELPNLLDQIHKYPSLTENYQDEDEELEEVEDLAKHVNLSRVKAPQNERRDREVTERGESYI